MDSLASGRAARGQCASVRRAVRLTAASSPAVRWGWVPLEYIQAMYEAFQEYGTYR